MNPDELKQKSREKLFRWVFLAGDKYKSSGELFIRFCRFCFIVTLVLFVISFVFYIGIANNEVYILKIRSAFRIIFLILFLSKFLPEFLYLKRKIDISFIFKIIVFLYSFGVFLSNFSVITSNNAFWSFFFGNIPIVIAILTITISEIPGFAMFISSINMPPALLFSASFFIIILIGSGLLLLPNAHNIPLTFLDSLFTSVSAVCVTGLIVVDTATAFTPLGKVIIICLIQIGGLGIMTFTGFFSFIFASSSTFRDRLLLKEIFSSQSLDNLFKLLSKIILWTFLTEAIGAIVIYNSLSPDSNNRLLFSIFHSVSAFCNAGFSTLTNGLFSTGLKNNYSIQISVALLIILGGIGFPVLLSVYSYFKQFLIAILRKAQRKRVPVIRTNMNISGKIVVFMTLILLFTGTGLYYIFESENSLKGNDTIQKLIISFFGSVSARTAGFNVIDISSWGYPTVFLMIVLMWIGASPGSTGGGIKTTTFAIAARSAYNSIRGRQHLLIGNREINSGTIIRVLAIIFLSILIITLGFFSLLFSEPGKNPVHLLFESVSAFCTVGLSLANTSSFSDAGKIILIILMFIGRVGPLTLFTGLLLSYRKNYSRYPEIDIIIN
jgi:trk system potassium uptake protein TrkH